MIYFRDGGAPVPDNARPSGGNMKRLAWTAVVVSAMLGGCGADEHSDLKAELAALSKDLRGRVEPLPQVKPYEPVPYAAASGGDPFDPSRLGHRPIVISDPPQIPRPREPLEAFPLESIRMVGTIAQKNEVFAVLKAGPNVYRVRTGNYLGQNFGVITEIGDGRLSLRELVQDASGEWVEREASLQVADAGR